ncbi:MAG: SDR family oxidoreductase [Deltaproteobacteria bacterium]|nr:SDR family oxidoreductase [Deltaproteobacteria bacterium]
MTVALVTGFPTSFLAVRVVRRLLEDPAMEVRLVVQETSLPRARELLGELQAGERARILIGDAAALDLGLSGAEIMALAEEVELIHHCVAATYLGVQKKTAERINVGTARETLELAELAKNLKRLVFWSTAMVAGKRKGRVLENELEPGGPFRNVVERTRMRAERMVREVRSTVPTTILRPSLVVGDSQTGEIDRLDGPYLLVLLMLNAPADLRVPLAGRGSVPLNLVPIDYVVEAGLHIASQEASLGRTFHLVDPAPPTTREVFERIAAILGKAAPRGTVPTRLATTLMRTPGLERYANVPRTFLEQLGTEVTYDDRNARALLEGSGIMCPKFEDYAETLISYVEAVHVQRRAEPVEVTVRADDLPS